MKPRLKLDCQHNPYCNCKRIINDGCETCQFYKIIDSGYGYCIALPIVIIVPFCKITCALFKGKNNA